MAAPSELATVNLLVLQEFQTVLLFLALPDPRSDLVYR